MHRPTAIHRRPEPQEGARVLVLLAHPALHRSRVNARLANAVRELPGVTFHDLYEAYPDFDIDVPYEQRLLLAHDILVWQHPFYWYSTPAILKEWQDLVLEYGWAYGPGGTKLHGKQMLSVISTGGPEHVYQPTGGNRYTMEHLLAPIDQTMHLCGIQRVKPLLVQGATRLSDAELDRYAQSYRDRLLSLVSP